MRSRFVTSCWALGSVGACLALGGMALASSCLLGVDYEKVASLPDAGSDGTAGAAGSGGAAGAAGNGGAAGAGGSAGSAGAAGSGASAGAAGDGGS